MRSRWSLAHDVVVALLFVTALPLALCADDAPKQPATEQPKAALRGGDELTDEKPKQSAPPEPPKELFSGRVVFLRDALKRRKIPAYDEVGDQVVLETADRELIPIVPDWRGRAFYQDARLRDRKVELVGYRRAGVPYLQVLMVFTFNEKGQREYMDYWCDICAIPMYQIEPCKCCQAPIRLRFQRQDLPDYVKLRSSQRKE